MSEVLEDLDRETAVVNSSKENTQEPLVSVAGEFCDRGLQSRSYRALKMTGATVTGIENETELDEAAGLRLSGTQRRDVSRYIRQLEYALLQQQTGRISSSEIVKHLENCVGFNLRPLSYSLESMYAEDA